MPVTSAAVALPAANREAARRLMLASLLVLLSALWPAVWGQTTSNTSPAPTGASASEPAVLPQVDRRDVKLPRIPSKDIEIGLLGGIYNTQNFGASGAAGLRLGYHLTEDFFAEGEFGRTKVSDQSFRAILPGGVLASGDESLGYATLSLGWNVLPGEIFLGSRQARATQFYLLGGIGSTDFVGQKRQTISLGLGMKVFTAQRWALRVDMRDHLYTLDLLGKRERTHNLQLNAGVSYFY